MDFCNRLKRIRKMNEFLMAATAHQTLDSWLEEVYRLSRARNKRESGAFRGIVHAYDKCIKQQATLTLECSNKKKELTDLNEQLRTYKQELEELRSTSPGKSVQTTKEIQNLKEKLLQKESEMNDLLQKDREYSKEIIELQKEMSSLRSKQSSFDEEYKKLGDEVRQERRLRHEIQNKYTEMKDSFEVFQEETDALREQVQQLTTERNELSECNDTQVAEIVRLKNQIAELVNAKNLEAWNTKLDVTVGRERERAKSSGSVGGGGSARRDRDKSPMGKEVLDTVRLPKSVTRTQIAHEDEVTSLSWGKGACENWLASGGMDKVVKLWDGRTGQLKSILHGSTMSIMSVDFSPNGELILGSSNDSCIPVWSTSLGRVKQTLTGHTNKVYSAKFFHDSRRILSGSFDRTLKYWDLAKGFCTKTTMVRSSCTGVDVFLDQTISGHLDGSVHLWDSRHYTPIHEYTSLHSGHVTSVSFSPCGRFILSSGRDNVLKVTDTRTYEEVATLEDPNFQLSFDHTRANFSPDSVYAVCGSANGSVLCWRISTGRVEARVRGHEGAVAAALWSDDGSVVVSAGVDKTIAVYE